MRGVPTSSSDVPPPRGFMYAVAQNMHAMETYARLTDEQRTALLHRAERTQPGKPMQRLVDHMEEIALQLPGRGEEDGVPLQLI